jgi:hypothetical protein
MPNETFESWWHKFCDGFIEYSGFKTMPNNMNPKDYQEYYERGDSPYECAWQQLDDLARSS